MTTSAVAVLAGIVVSLFAQSPGAPGAPPPTVAPTDIRRHAGREVTSCGRVVMYDCEESSGSLLLALRTPSSTRDGVSVEIRRQHWSDSGGQQITNQYLFADVCARGKVAKAGSRYKVVINGPDAIELVSRPQVSARSRRTRSRPAPRA